MSIVEAFVYLTVFIMLYGGMLVCGYIADKCLRAVFGFGIFPKGYFDRS